MHSPPAYWVDAAPFRALVIHLMNQTGLCAPELASCARVPRRVVQSLLHKPPRRIRAVDAARLLTTCPTSLRSMTP